MGVLSSRPCEPDQEECPEGEGEPGDGAEAAAEIAPGQGVHDAVDGEDGEGEADEGEAGAAGGRGAVVAPGVVVAGDGAEAVGGGVDEDGGGPDVGVGAVRFRGGAFDDDVA